MISTRVNLSGRSHPPGEGLSQAHITLRAPGVIDPRGQAGKALEEKEGVMIARSQT